MQVLRADGNVANNIAGTASIRVVIVTDKNKLRKAFVAVIDGIRPFAIGLSRFDGVE